MAVNTSIDFFYTQLPLTCEQLWVGFSGGLDSTVLLHSLKQLLPTPMQQQLRAIHIHHGLSPNADSWAQHCQQICDAWSIPLTIQLVDAKPQSGESPEAAARQARYQVFTKLIRKNTMLALAHHADDQAETVLLQLLRGAGPKGLAAMPAIAEFAEGLLARPLLSLSRQQLMQYAIAAGLTWIDDESNANIAFDRNYIRHQVMPQLAARWPAAVTCIARSAQHCADANQLSEELAGVDLQECIFESAPEHTNIISSAIIDCRKLQLLDKVRQKNVIRCWLQQQHLPLPSTVKLQQILDTIVASRHDATPCVTWPTAEVRRFRYGLYAMPPQLPHDATWEHVWDVSQDLTLPAGLGILSAAQFQPLAQGKPLHVRFRRGGEMMHLPHRAGHHTLKKLMQEWNIPPWQRDRTPLLYRDGKLIAVASKYTKL
jgi:tRNA(Ile)-lysidine synthase